MLDHLHARCELLSRFLRIDGESALQDSWSGIQLFGHEMHGAAVPCISGIQHTLVGIEPRMQR